MNTSNLYEQPTGLQIGTPRMMSPRSHRTYRSTRSHRPRRHSPNVTNHLDNSRNDTPIPPSPQPVAENLHRDNSTFNVDPAAPMLGAGGDSIQEAMQAEDHRNELRREKNLAGGFMVGLKRALKPTWNGGQQRSDPEAAYGHTPYTADDMYLPGSDHADMEEAHGYTDHSYPAASSSESQPSPSSETMHGTQEYPDDGTTAVDHHSVPMPIPGHYVSPILVEPQLAPDYAKMDSPSPTTSDASLNTYMSRVAKFLRQINELPWIADSRVTVDYYPGQSKRRIRPRPAHRAILSWYNRHAFLPGQNTETLDLDAGASPPPEPAPVILMAETQKSSTEPKPTFQPLVLPTVPIPESQLGSGPTYLAEPIVMPPPPSETQHSARTGRSVVYSVVNPSAPSTSSSSTSPLTQVPPRNLGIDAMTALAQNTTGYTPYQPTGLQYGRAVHEPQSQVLLSPTRTASVAHVRTEAPAQAGSYAYPV
ncbi:hypothetical protein GYMLUDRAFT_483219 [Collybiopsis luxurians FD-317 M1]|uniref:Uncharacterized protein n=1 Tax=Collybiopsis luxurians FD-317 M1 TaxID=944289 RepID=A0A0D0BGU0_9AGAR|nr:hypothetical protein GYMLUDRAFT_483219 [Collybiopsis luxurians FD-317 M1]